MGLNPYNSNKPHEWKDSESIGLEGATVTRTKPHEEGDDVGHVVFVQPDTVEEDVAADVAVNQTGDVQIPDVGSRVVIGYRVNERPLVLGQRYSVGDTVPPFAPGERVIGHPSSDSSIRLSDNGSVTITGDSGVSVELTTDGTVVVNDGDTKAVTDVQAASTNDNGGITSLDITRSDSILVE